MDMPIVYLVIKDSVNAFIPNVSATTSITRLGGRTRIDLIHDVLLTLCERHANPESIFSFDTVTRPYLRTRTFQVLCNIFTRGCKIAAKWELDPEAEQEDGVVDLENLELLTEALARIEELPSEGRDIMRMRAMEYTYEEISESLADKGVQLSPLAIRQRVFHLRKKLTASMAPG
jgi:DNA-directed RNA polymerase specialized sigma24 family protein